MLALKILRLVDPLGTGEVTEKQFIDAFVDRTIEDVIEEARSKQLNPDNDAAEKMEQQTLITVVDFGLDALQITGAYVIYIFNARSECTACALMRLGEQARHACTLHRALLSEGVCLVTAKLTDEHSVANYN